MSAEPLRLAADPAADPTPDPQAGDPGRLRSGRSARATAPVDPLLLTVPEVAALLRIDPRTLQRWDAAGRIPGRLQLGRLVRYRREAVLKWLEQGCPELPRKRR